MLLEREPLPETQLIVPDALLPNSKQRLPELNSETLALLGEFGWSRVGLMVAFIDSAGNVMMLGHNGRDKNNHGALGPLGETSQQSGPVIEQPIETLFRGIQEELGIQQPSNLEFWMHSRGGWVINHWPRGNDYANQFACAISFPVFINDAVRGHLSSIPHGTEEISSMSFLSADEILAMDETALRPGVKAWLSQLINADLLNPDQNQKLQKVDFSNIYESSLRDIELQP
ncbi:MAG TPA: hypothetical protein VLG25_02455 [Patescibacteria group bacterium]|nr:hypothetical protein [Patescibacteria group bacterium]